MAARVLTELHPLRGHEEAHAGRREERRRWLDVQRLLQALAGCDEKALAGCAGELRTRRDFGCTSGHRGGKEHRAQRFCVRRIAPEALVEIPAALGQGLQALVQPRLELRHTSFITVRPVRSRDQHLLQLRYGLVLQRFYVSFASCSTVRSNERA